MIGNRWGGMAKRGYQTYAIDQSFEYLYNTTGNGVIVMPTGTGKSHVIAGIVERALIERPNAKIHMLTHVKELIDQNLEKLVDAWPNAPVGVYSAGLGTKQTNMPIIYGGIASMINAVDELDAPDLTLIDECHLFNPNSDTMYAEYHALMRERNPYIRSIGLTATDWRMKGGRLTDPGNFFTDTIVNMADMRGFNWFIEQGYLVKLLPRPTDTKYDLTGVGVSGEEYKPGELQRAMDKPEITWAALQETLHYGFNRRKWLVFASGVEHADHVCEMLNKMGIPTTVLHRGIPKAERRERLKDFKAGKYRACVNNNILTTGFDDPTIDLIVCLRPTLSSSLWVQMLGRGTRPYYALGYDLETQNGRLMAIANSPKQNCLVLDFAGNAAQLGPVNDPVIPKRVSGAGGDPPIKICETKRLKEGYTGCGTYNHASVRYCDACNAEFNFAVKFGVNASIQKLIADGIDDFEWFDVQNVYYSQQVGPSGVPYLRVDYWISSKKKYMDFIHLQQTGFMLHRAKQWWQARALHPPEWGIPPTVADALKVCNKQYMKQPTKIRVWKNKQPLPEIVNYEYE